MNHRFATALLIALAIPMSVSSTGCKKLGGNKGDGGVDGADGGASGIDAPQNDAKVVTLAKAALACPTSGTSFFQYDCPAYKAWNEAKLLSGPVDATLVNMLEDKTARVRYLAAQALQDSKATYRSDKALASRVIAVAEAETDEQAGGVIGGLVGKIDVDKTGLLEPITKIAKKHNVTRVRRGIVEGILFTNNRSRPTYDFMITMTNDADKDVRLEAVRAFWIGGSLSKTETCKMYEAHLSDSEPSISAKSAELMGMSRNCSPNYDALVAAVDRASSGPAKKESGFVSGLQKMCEDTEAKPAQRSKAATLAKALVAAKDNQVFVRKWGLRAVLACDPKGGKGFVAGYTKDKEKWVAEEAADLLKPKK